EIAGKTLAHHYSFVFPNGTHGQMSAHPCAGRVMQDFITDPTARPHPDCIQTLAVQPYYTHAISCISRSWRAACPEACREWSKPLPTSSGSRFPPSFLYSRDSSMAWPLSPSLARPADAEATVRSCLDGRFLAPGAMVCGRRWRQWDHLP